MTMVGSGTIALAGTGTVGPLNQSVEVELGGGGSSVIALNDATVRALAGIPSGAISLSDFYNKSAFSPHTDTFNSGSGTIPVPSGAVQLIITLFGHGGDGGLADIPGGFNGGAGGGGAKSVKTIALVSADWGVNLNYAVGASTTSSGTLNAGSFSMTANKGGDGQNSTPVNGAGGTASGGDTNVSGSTSGSAAGGNAATGGGTGGVPEGNGNAPGGGGGAGIFSGTGNPGFGAAGRASFAWS